MKHDDENKFIKLGTTSQQVKEFCRNVHKNSAKNSSVSSSVERHKDLTVYQHDRSLNPFASELKTRKFQDYRLQIQGYKKTHPTNKLIFNISTFDLTANSRTLAIHDEL